MNADKIKLSGLDDATRERLDGITHTIISAAFEVCNTLGAGYLEKVYENALAYELRQRGLNAQQQQPLLIRYKNVVMGEYFADILVEGSVIIELKCADRIVGEHTAQCLNYLRGTNLHVGLILNFQRPRLEYKRVVRNF